MWEQVQSHTCVSEEELARMKRAVESLASTAATEERGESVPAVFHFGDIDYDHIRGDPECGGCWREPEPCGDGCPGLVHTQFGDENASGDYWLYRKCDVCGG